MKSLEKNSRHILIDNISFDRNNPRGEGESQIINDPEFKKLVASIQEHGILEPLIIKRDSSNTDHYLLIDGERRLRAAKKIAEDNSLSDYKVPALIAKDDTDGRILAYQVHMLRKQWNKASETKAIKAILADLKIEQPSLSDKELLGKLKVITAHTDKQLAELLILLSLEMKPSIRLIQRRSK